MKRKDQHDSTIYNLRDYLEMHCSINAVRVKRIVKRVLNEGVRGKRLYQLTSVALGDTLIVAREGSRKKIKNVYIISDGRAIKHEVNGGEVEG
jgi:hypothetical protein